MEFLNISAKQVARVLNILGCANCFKSLGNLHTVILLCHYRTCPNVNRPLLCLFSISDSQYLSNTFQTLKEEFSDKDAFLESISVQISDFKSLNKILAAERLERKLELITV